MTQYQVPMYGLVLSGKKIRELWTSRKIIVDQFDPSKSNPGYQRVVDPERTRELAEALNQSGSSTDILPTLLPGAIVLNCRNRGLITFEAPTSTLRVPDSAELYVIDGQHRIEAIVASNSNDDFLVAVLDGLNVVQEAGQFLVINTKQKRVRPDLQLRVLYGLDRNNTHRLIEKLGLENWRIPALTLCIALADNLNSPWRNMILRPGEKRAEERKRGRWKPMTEGNFVDTLRFFCGGRSPVRSLGMDEKETMLVDYWDAVSKAYPRAFSQSDGRNYMICRSIGVGSLNDLAPVIYWCKQILNSTYKDLLALISKKFKLDDFWSRRRGKATGYGSGHAAYSGLATDMLISVLGTDYVDERQLRLLQKGRKKPNRPLEKAYDALRPIYLRSTGDIEQSLSGYGCYALVQVKPELKVYVGKSQNVKQRIGQHPRKYQLYNRSETRSERETQDTEMALFHLVKHDFLENTNHPPPADACPFC